MIEAEVSEVVVKFVFFFKTFWFWWYMQMVERIITHYYLCVDLKWSETTQMLDVMLIYWEFMNKAGVEFHFVPGYFFFNCGKRIVYKTRRGTWLFFKSDEKCWLSDTNRLKSFLIQKINKKKHEKWICVSTIIIGFFFLVLFKSDSFNNTK